MISTRWRMPAGRSEMRWSGSMCNPYCSLISPTRSRTAAGSKRPTSPSATFSHTVQRLDEAEVLVDHGDAAARPRRRDRRSGTGSPSRRIWPASGSTSPISTFIRVDLPAPFSPRIPWTCPRCSVEVDAVAGHHPAEALRDPDQLDGGRGPGSPVPVRDRLDRRVDIGASVSPRRTPPRRSPRTARRSRRAAIWAYTSSMAACCSGVGSQITAPGSGSIADLEQLDVALLEGAIDDLGHHGTDVVAAVELDGDVVVELLLRLAHRRGPGAHHDQTGLVGRLHDRAVGATEVRVDGVGPVVDGGLQRRGGVGRVVEVEREVAGRHVRHRVGRIDGLQPELEGHVAPASRSRGRSSR